MASPRESGLLPTMCASSGLGVTIPPTAPRVVRPDVCGDLVTRCLLSFFPRIGMRLFRSSSRAREHLPRAVERDVQRFREIRAPAKRLELPRADDRPQRLLADLGENERGAVMPAFLRQ